MGIRICTYNVEWFNRLFTSNTNNLKTDQKSVERLDAIAAALKLVNADFVGIVEAPNTKISGSESTTARLKTFATTYGLRTTSAIISYVSAGQQELAVLFDPSKVKVKRAKGGTKKVPAFDQEFLFDSDYDKIQEVYKFYRPPLEAKVAYGPTNKKKKFRLMLVHPKTKGIFSAMDKVHLERESMRCRRKLLAECSWIRARVDEWLQAGERVVVMGDINDGPGMDEYEWRFGRSAVEVIMGDLFDPDTVLRNYAGRPKWTDKGWNPASTRYTDRLTQDPINVLIDHILVSKDIKAKVVNKKAQHIIWNPYENKAAKPLKSQLTLASDHFPVSLDIL
ncbi:hypothetical protein ACFL51_00350 [Myxococcota bacterium]